MKKRYIILIVFITILVSNILMGLLISWDLVSNIWKFISDQILGMKWLNVIIGDINSLFGEEYSNSVVGKAIQFFVYDFIKIGILLCVLIFTISYIQSFFPPERTKKILEKYQGIKGNIIGALLGTVTPFCSCSSIPIFVGFTRAGLSSGITFSFLISSPLVDLGSLMLLVGFFGWKIAIAYVLVGLILAIIGGTIIDKTGLGKHIHEFVRGENTNQELEEMTKKERLIYAKNQMIQTYKKVVLYIVIGVLIGSIIHNVIPEVWIQNILGQDKWYSVLLATILGTPMYADIFGALPIAEALFSKGAGLGTILAFMMSVTALSLPSMIMIKKVVKTKLFVSFVFIVITGIIIIGYLFNGISYIFT